MTKFTNVIKVSIQSRLRMTTRLLMINLIVVAVSFVFTLFVSTVRPYWSLSLFLNLLFWIIIFAIAIMVQMIISSRNNLRSNRFRLIPITETKLYVADSLSSLISFIYANIIQVIILFVSLKLLWLTLPNDDIGAGFRAGFIHGNSHSGGVGGNLASLLSPILIIMLVHLVDFFSTFILNYIPGGAQKFVKIIVYLVVISIAVYLIFNVIKILYSLFTGNLVHQATSIWLANGVIAALVIVVGAINIYLLRRVETIR
ncbi:hypothetical protein [Bombilactobacillus bombi]|uniref:hypothetical protein n=1 Tax=Bombilactobacillus bombi TaxID=1303590 RepID=UPI0015E5C3F2|nr:hypothetical protein [Bombilactobacillus bombi]MBA1434046.1 hypothetical protein [Bombilactobacillus bombi]